MIGFEGDKQSKKSFYLSLHVSPVCDRFHFGRLTGPSVILEREGGGTVNRSDAVLLSAWGCIALRLCPEVPACEHAGASGGSGGHL